MSRRPSRPAGSHQRRPTHRQAVRRRIVAGVVALAVLAGVGVGVTTAVTALGPTSRQADPHHSDRRPPPSTAPSQPGAGPTTSVRPPPPRRLPALSDEPGGGQRLFPARRIVAFYGAPGGDSLGVLGGASPAATWPALAAQAAPYAQPGVPVLPAYELITYVAQAAPGPAGTYTAMLPPAKIDQYLAVIRAHRGMLILDIQPGRGSLLADTETLAPYLDHPDVGLALDPEWEVTAPQLPGHVIGHTTAAQINAVGRWLDHFTAAHRLPQKLLLIHQFTPQMIVDKPAVHARYHLATVFNMDGYGTWADKLGVYHALATDPRWHLGFKLFYRQDTPLHPPGDILALAPTPSIIEYQ